MVRNPERRAALLDAAIEVLADEGARGLTFRTVDATAAVPIGTTSNYFTARDELLTQVGVHAFDRIGPDPDELERSATGPATREQLIKVMQDLVARLIERRSVYLAMLELRLEATRRPALREMFTGRVREDLSFNIGNHAVSGLPGDRQTVIMLVLALTGLVIEQITLPGVLADEGSTDELVARIVGIAIDGTGSGSP